MVTTTSFGTVAAVLEAPGDEALREVFRSRIKRIMGPLMTAENLRRFRNRLEKAVIEYTPIKMRIAAGIAANVTQSGDSAEVTLKQINEAAWDAFAAEAHEELAAQDKLVVLDILSINTELGRLIDETPEDNKAAVMAALLDAHWALQRLDVILTALLLIRNGELKLENKATLHWLCLAAKLAIEEWRSTVFGHSPLLRARLLQPRRALSDKEMGNRLGLPA